MIKIDHVNNKEIYLNDTLYKQKKEKKNHVTMVNFERNL